MMHSQILAEGTMLNNEIEFRADEEQKSYEHRFSTTIEHLGTHVFAAPSYPMTQKSKFTVLLSNSGSIPSLRETFFDDTINFPYLPPKVKSLLGQRRLTNKQRVDLMTFIAEATIEHFKLKDGTFVAINLRGRILEASSSRIELLKKIQNIPSSEPLFLWEVGNHSFSGWY